MSRTSMKRRNTKPIPHVEPLTSASFIVPRLSDSTFMTRVEIEDAGFDDETGCYVTRFRFGETSFRNEFDPKDVPFGALREARDIANAALLAEHFDLDLRNGERMRS